MVEIREFRRDDSDAVVRLSLRAWSPLFGSIRDLHGADVYDSLHPDPGASQQADVEAVLASSRVNVWVAVVDGDVAGFVAVDIQDDRRFGEIAMLAVDPDRQRHRIGAELTEFALAWIKGQGVNVAMVETGSDPGHAPARRTYERSGFGLVPVARYWKKL